MAAPKSKGALVVTRLARVAAVFADRPRGIPPPKAASVNETREREEA